MIGGEDDWGDGDDVFSRRAEYGGMKSDQLNEAVSIVQMSLLRDGPAGVTTFNGRVEPNFVVS
jgi:hypothetical protein